MSIGHIQEKIKEALSRAEKRDVYTPFIIILTTLISFFLGNISHVELSKAPVLIEIANMPKAPIITEIATSSGKYVASKTGKKYHLSSCPGAKSIAETNRISFDTKEAAEKAGFTPASNCKGI